MYGCDCHIGCLSGSVTRIGSELVGSASRVGQELLGSVDRLGYGLKGHVSMVCSLNKDSYLRVAPDVVWLTSDMISGEFDIYSNVDWTIN